MIDECDGGGERERERERVGNWVLQGFAHGDAYVILQTKNREAHLILSSRD